MLQAYGRFQQQRLNHLDLKHTQNKVLYNLVKNALGSRFATDHDFDALAKDFSYAAYCQRVPLCSYEELWERYLAPNLSQLDHVLTRGKVTHLACTSGSSSGQEKYMPVNSAFVAHMKKSATLQGVFNYLRVPDLRLLTQPACWLTDLSDFSTVGSYPTAMISRIIRERTGAYPRLFPSEHLLTVGSPEDRFDRLISAACQQRFLSVAGITPWLLAFLKKIIERTKSSSIHDVWPHLKLVVHAGVAFEPYRAQLDALMQKPVVYTENYVATEGFLGIQDLNSSALRCLPSHGLFYEFIKLSERELPAPERFPLWRVEPGIAYSLCVTNPAGFWSMEIGDVVVFDRVLPYPRFRVQGRVKEKCDFFGEKLLLREIELALQKTCQAFDGEFFHMAVGPAEHGLHLVIESTPFDDVLGFESLLDTNLRAVNVQYQRNRSKSIQQAARVTFFPKNTFQRWLVNQEETKLQRKLPRLFDSTQQLHQFIKEVQNLC